MQLNMLSLKADSSEKYRPPQPDLREDLSLQTNEGNVRGVTAGVVVAMRLTGVRSTKVAGVDLWLAVLRQARARRRLRTAHPNGSYMELDSSLDIHPSVKRRAPRETRRLKFLAMLLLGRL